VVTSTVILEGKNLERLISEAEAHFKTSKDFIKIEVIEEKKTLFGKHYKISATIEDNDKYNSLSEIINNIENDLKTAETGNNAQNSAIDDNEIDIPIEVIDSKYEVTVSADLMEAYIYVHPPVGGRQLDKEDVYKALEEKNIKSGILNDEIDKLVNERIYNSRVLIAKGKPAINGEDAKIEYKFNISQDKKVFIADDGRVDYKELSLIKNVNKGEILATMIPSTKGTNGENVYGKEIKAKDGKQIKMPKGKNVEVSEDGLQLISLIDGEVKIVDNKISVFPVYTVQGNVDNSTGNIRFIGKVVIKGNVLTGFTIDADDDVEVFGVVEGAVINSRGSIILHRGIQGMNKGKLVCEGDLIAKFIENSNVYAKGNIQTDAIMHSTVYCGKKLEVQGRKGLIVGGEIKVSDEIKAKIIGSPMATITEVEVGVNPDVRKKYDKLKLDKDKNSENLKKLTQAVDMLTKLSRKEELSNDKRELLNKSILLKLQTQKALDDLEKEIKEIAEYIEDIPNGKIKVENVVYSGTKITIGSSSMYVRDQMQYVTFYRTSGEIKIGSYEP